MKTIATLLGKLIDFEEGFVLLYNNIAKTEGATNIQLKNTAMVLSREEQRHIVVYRKLYEDFSAGEPIYIDEDLIANVEYYLITIKQTMGLMPIENSLDLIALAIDYENKHGFIISKILDLLREDLQGHEEVIKTFEGLLKEEYKHVENLQVFIK